MKTMKKVLATFLSVSIFLCGCTKNSDSDHEERVEKPAIQRDQTVLENTEIDNLDEDKKTIAFNQVGTESETYKLDDEEIIQFGNRRLGGQIMAGDSSRFAQGAARLIGAHIHGGLHALRADGQHGAVFLCLFQQRQKAFIIGNVAGTEGFQHNSFQPAGDHGLKQFETDAREYLEHADRNVRKGTAFELFAAVLQEGGLIVLNRNSRGCQRRPVG